MERKSPEEELKEGQRRVAVRLILTFLGAALIINSFLAEVFLHESEVAGFSAFAGALILSMPVIVGAIQDLISGEHKMRELVALALVGCFALEGYQIAGVVAFFMLISELVERRAALGAHEALRELLTLSPKKARVLDENNVEREVEVSQLTEGLVVSIRPGENVPADGVITEGTSALNEATITGESMPADKGKGDEVFAGTTNLTSHLKVKVLRAGKNTVLGKVRTLIIEAQETKLHLMRLVDRYMGWYTPVALMIAGAIFFFTRDSGRGVSALVVSCPVAVILAMPTAMVAALSCAARMGVLIKNVGDLEVAGGVNAICFDKTGTLTTGELSVKKVVPGNGYSRPELLKLVASVERYSNHPMAKAIVKTARGENIEILDCEKFREVAGRGVMGVVGRDELLVGRQGWLNENGIDCGEYSKLVEESLSTLYVASAGKCIGAVGLEDRTRDEARGSVEGLKQLGIVRVMMFTGDREIAGKKLSEDLGCTDFEAECLPQRKLEIVEKLRAEGYRVAVVGDGVNDAPALAAGDIGVAIGAAGSDIAINSATIALMGSDLGKLPFLIRLSQRAMHIVYQNLIIGVLSVVTGLILSGFGVLTPVVASLFYTAGSFVVVFNSARLIRYS